MERFLFMFSNSSCTMCLVTEMFNPCFCKSTSCYIKDASLWMLIRTPQAQEGSDSSIYHFQEAIGPYPIIISIVL